MRRGGPSGISESPVVIEAAITPLRVGAPIQSTQDTIDEAKSYLAQGSAIVHHHHDLRLERSDAIVQNVEVEDQDAASALRDTIGGRQSCTLRCCSRCRPSLEVSIRDVSREPLPPGQRGEIWVRGEQVSGKYLGKSVLVEDGWFPTRDAGHLDEGGYLFVHGRLDDVIVRGGQNLSPGEIEVTFLSHPAVAQAAVVGIPSTGWGEQVAAAVVLAEGADTTETELQDHVRNRLRSTKTPEHIQFRDELPYNETGKLLRRIRRDELEKAHV